MNATSRDQPVSVGHSRLLAGIVAAYLLSAIIGGTFWYVVRLAVSTDGTGYPPCTAAAFRFILAAVIFTVVWWTGMFGKPVLSAKLVLWFAGAGAASASATILIYTAQVRLTGGMVSVILATTPLIVAIILWRLRIEIITGAVLTASTIAVAGVAVVYWDSLGVPGHSSAIIYIAIAALVFACSNVIFKERDDQVIGKITVFFCAGSVVLVIAAFVQEERLPFPPPAVPTLALCLTVLGNLSFAAYAWMLQHVRLMTAMTLAFVHPLIAVATDALWESKSLRPTAYFGIAMVVGGVVLNWFCSPRVTESPGNGTAAAEPVGGPEPLSADDSA